MTWEHYISNCYNEFAKKVLNDWSLLILFQVAWQITCIGHINNTFIFMKGEKKIRQELQFL